MKTFLARIFIVVTSLSALAHPASAENMLIDFESEIPRIPSGSYWVPNPGFTTANATFIGGNYEGFTISNSTATGDYGYLYSLDFPPQHPSPTAEISAESNGGMGGGYLSEKFAVGSGAEITIDLPSGYRPLSVWVTNTATTAYFLANTVSGFQSRAMGEGDAFSVTFHGWDAPGAMGNATGNTTFVLGSFSGGNATIVKEWTWVDLTDVGDAVSMSLSYDSYDVDPIYGINTPTYVAIDNLTIAPVPEPSTWALGAGAVVAAWGLHRRLIRES